MHSETTICAVCGSAKAKIRSVSRTYGRGRDLLVIENVPLISCPDCGTRYLTASTLKELDRIKRERKTAAVTKPVEVASFSAPSMQS